MKFCTLKLKSIGLSGSLSGSFTHAWLCNPMHWPFRKYCSLSYINLPNVDISSYTMSKRHIIKSAQTSSESPLVLGSCQAHRRHTLSKILLSHEGHILSVLTTSDGCFPWRGRLASFIFKKKVCHLSQVWNTVISQFFSSENYVSIKKVLGQFISQASATGFSCR